MAKIVDVVAREILDSRGFPTVEVDVSLDDGSFGRSSVPSGASTGTYEAHELRDNDSRYHGKGVLKAVYSIVYVIKPQILGVHAHEQKNIDHIMMQADGSKNKCNLGANALLGVSLACAKAAAVSLKIPFYEYIQKLADNKRDIVLPRPMMNVINGGVHADNALDFQEFMIVPMNSSCVKESIRIGSEIFQNLKKILKQNKLNTNVGDEGGFAPQLQSTRQTLNYLIDAIKVSGYKPGRDVCIALDVAANELRQDDGTYTFEGENISSSDLVNVYKNLCEEFPIISIEDGFAEEDFDAWALLTKELGDKVQIVGDDLFVTNVEKLKMGVDQKLANAILIKPNQIGTLTETLETIKYAQENYFNCIISHRSGETEDTSIADIAVGTSAGQIKTGSLSRTDRVAKYNQLIRIEEQIS
ncbi:MAG: phosphopyruvate hydratase [Candidatus Puniceispirillum sp.]|nr:phosphopyruvate hydratase [Candidatus Pelagibacter sp.]MBA4283004.1 phosphopyruvate hydratase [Candidatus Puniceispirillum sp.]